MRTISPSLLSANFANIEKDIKDTVDAGVTRLHLDVMDGHFVPNLTFGPMVIKHIRKITTCHLETHLMINKPHKSFDQYIEAGSDTLIFHIEASDDPIRDLKYIKSKNVLAGIALNPDTHESSLFPLMDYLDYILIMSVFPGKGGQKFIKSTLSKMKALSEMKNDKNIVIGVDGGVNTSTIKEVYATGIDITIVGSAFFNSKNLNERHDELLNA